MPFQQLDRLGVRVVGVIGFPTADSNDFGLPDRVEEVRSSGVLGAMV